MPLDTTNQRQCTKFHRKQLKVHPAIAFSSNSSPTYSFLDEVHSSVRAVMRLQCFAFCYRLRWSRFVALRHDEWRAPRLLRSGEVTCCSRRDDKMTDELIATSDETTDDWLTIDERRVTNTSWWVTNVDKEVTSISAACTISWMSVPLSPVIPWWQDVMNSVRLAVGMTSCGAGAQPSLAYILRYRTPFFHCKTMPLAPKDLDSIWFGENFLTPKLVGLPNSYLQDWADVSILQLQTGHWYRGQKLFLTYKIRGSWRSSCTQSANIFFNPIFILNDWHSGQSVSI